MLCAVVCCCCCCSCSGGGGGGGGGSGGSGGGGVLLYLCFVAVDVGVVVVVVFIVFVLLFGGVLLEVEANISECLTIRCSLYLVSYTLPAVQATQILGLDCLEVRRFTVSYFISIK